METTTNTRLVPVQALLLALCAASLVALGAWIVGYNGLGISTVQLPDQLMFANEVMGEDVTVRGEAGVATAVAANGVIGPLDQYNNDPDGTPNGASEFYGNEAGLSFWAPTWSQHAAWVAVRAIPLAGMALIWWLLFTIVRGVGHDEGFTPRVANRLRVIGLLILIGAPLMTLAQWGVATWLVEGSTAGKIADAAPLSIAFWPIALGVAVLVISGAWRQAAGMRDDLEGLV